MSQSMMRKPQPFTIGTRLSIPKCPDLSTSSPGVDILDSTFMSQNLSARVSQYLAQANPSPCMFSTAQRQTVHPHSPAGGSTDGNNGSQARSIKKITLSRHSDATYKEGTVRISPRVLAKNSHGNFNNNNSRGLRHFSPDAIDIPFDWTSRNPKSITGVDCNTSTTTHAKYARAPCDSTQSSSVKTAPSSGSALIRGRRPSLENDSLIAQLNLDIKQAESWVRGKLQDLNDQCDICPLQDWDRGAQSLQGDIADFESTIMRLSQMGDHLSRSQSTNTSIRTQLQTLRDQWQLLKQTATNQNKTVGGAKALLEFNKKADELEIWMRAKEENPPLSLLLDENFDKMQLTRRILDLKQDQLYYRNLQDNMNSLAQKLEKQGRAESKGTSTRRKHLNRMWLRIQTTLEEHHQSLQLALEAASLWQQADTILRAMEEKRNSAGVNKGGRGHQDLRDIASQIMMLDITVSQVSSLHPILASRALHKQRRVKESWAQLQQSIRTEKPTKVTFTREPGNCVTSDSEEQSGVGNQQQRILGSQIEETSSRDFHMQNPLHSPPETQTERKLINVTPAASRRQGSSLADREQTQSTQQYSPSSNKPETNHLLNELNSTTQWLQSVELLLSEPTAMRSPEFVRRDLRQVSVLEREVKSRGLALHCLGGKARRLRVPEWTVNEETQVKVLEVEERFQIVQDALRRRASDLRDTLVLSEFMKVVQMEEERKKKKEVPTTGGSARGAPDTQAVTSDRTERFTPLEDLQEAVEMLNDAVKERERAVAATREMTNLESSLAALSQMMASASARLQDVGRQMEAAEQDFTAVKKQTDMRELQGMFIQQQQLESDMSGAISEELRKLDEGRDRLQELCPVRSQKLGWRIEETLQACSHLQGHIQENQNRLQRTARLRDFFLSYLGMISWTEDMRAQVLLESPGDRLSPGRREELEKSIEGKLKEFEVLAGIGWKLIGEDHLLAQTIKERLEELQGMLSWVLMRWRCQKQRIGGNKTQRLKTNEVLESSKVMKEEPHHTTRSVASEEFQCLKNEGITPTSQIPRGPPLRRYRKKALSPMLFQHPFCKLSASPDTETEDGAELQEDNPRKCGGGPLWLEPKVLPTGSETPEPGEEPLMVSTYLNMKDSEKHNTCQSLTVPRLSRKTRSSEQYSLIPAYGSSTNAFPKIRSHLLFKSFKRKKKAQRLTVQGIMGVYSDKKHNTKETIKYRTSTWPPKLERNTPALEPHPDFETFLNYVKNPLTKHIDAECVVSGSVLKKSELKRPTSDVLTTHSSCQRLTLGSVLTLQLPKELNLLDSNQEAIAVVSKDDIEFANISDSGRADESQCTVNGKPVKEEEHCNITIKETHSSSSTSWIEALSSSSGYCRQNIHGYGKSIDSLQSRELEDLTDDFINFKIDRLSPIVLQNLEPEWAKRRAALNSPETKDVILADCKDSNSHHKYHSWTGIYSSSVCQKAGGNVHCVKTYNDDEQKHEQLRSNCSSVDFPNANVKTSSPVHEPYIFLETPPGSRTFNKANPHSFPEVLHPDHEFLEHDDEELEGIWNNARKGQPGGPTQTSDNVSLKETGEGYLSPVKHTDPCGKVIMRTEPNLLVATFTLPNSAALATDYVREKGPDPCQNDFCRSKSVVAACPDYHLPGVSETVQGPVSPKLDTAKEDSTTSTVTRKLDFHLMEGPLEKKHILQPGGKKASCRTWGVFYAVLVRRTLCFYHDRKHSTKSSLSSPPLHLTGAVCTTESDYVKRSNCFRLRLTDGSEYLFRAPTSELLQEWVSKVRHNSGMEDTDLLVDSMLGTNLSPCHMSRVDSLSPWMSDLCHPIPVRGRDLVHRPHQKEPENVQADDCRASTCPQLPSRLPESENADPDRDSNLMESRRRSQSFSSVTYQKMSSVPNPQEIFPNYSVTLYIDDPMTRRGRCHSFATSHGEAHTSHMADLKPRNKSVFRKFFRKKE
ncbi:uncharacterized protein LOC142145032 isoform X1 [Mixophyes fleayi]|uniref:uncharacterized protein LOC142145032 isoform X1 n=1 Tax=Mixophyes fleayi TaxID=3061075 RepID=UPI003F4DF320